MKSRLVANRQILQKLKDYLETYPNLRFGQAMRNLGIVNERRLYDGKNVFPADIIWVDEFNFESEDLLTRVIKEEIKCYK